MKNICLALVAACVLFSGCAATTSLHPILNEKDMTTDLELHGDWVEVNPEKGGSPTKFSLDGGEEWYELVLPDAATDAEGPWKDAELELWLGKIGDRRYFQVQRTDKDNLVFLQGAFPYAFGKFEFDGELLKIYPVDDQKFLELAKMFSLDHKDVPRQPFFERELLVTASTAKIQAFLQKHDKVLFKSTPLEFRRSKPVGNKQAVDKTNGKDKNGKDKNKDKNGKDKNGKK